MNTENPVIMFDSEQAASIQTVTGWVSRTGRFWGEDELLARSEGCTHKRCECGNIVEIRSYCEVCFEHREVEQFMAMPKEDWDGVAPLCIHGTDIYFFDVDSLLMHCEDNGCEPKELNLVICVPQFAKEIEPNEHYADELPEDGELPADIEEAFRVLNAAIKACKEPLSWYPGKIAVTPESLPTLEPEDA